LADHNKTTEELATIKAALRPGKSIGHKQSGSILTSSKQKIVAVIDDDPSIRASLAKLLSSRGYGTEMFDSAEAFLNAAATSKASCLVIDIHLGDISGLELARQLAADGFKYPVIFMTGLTNEIFRDQAAAADAIAFLTKPFPARFLIEAIEKAIG
jgi:FixJ family two-component response regulator